MNKLFLPLLIFLLSSTALSQTFQTMKVGDSSPRLSSSIMEIKSSNRGLLIPRMTTVQKNAIVSPALGLLVYDTTVDSISEYTGSGWANLGAGGDGGISSIGSFDGQTPSSNGGVISGSTLYFQSASSSNPGLVNTTTQTLGAGTKSADKLNSFSTFQIAGTDALTRTTTTNNVYVGLPASTVFTTGQQNTVISSSNSGDALTSGSFNTYIANNVGGTASTGIVNVGIGDSALRDLTTGSFHTAVGGSAGASVTSANSGTFFGYQAGSSVTSAAGITALGVGAAGNVNTGALNSAGGVQALRDATTAPNNTAFGATALSGITTGLGSNAGFGKDAGASSITGSYGTFIGTASDATASNLTNVTAIGYGALVGASNSMVLGSGGINVGIDSITTPTARLHLPGGSASASSASLKIASGATLSSVEAGAIENDGTNLWYTTNTPTREKIFYSPSITQYGIVYAGSTTQMAFVPSGSSGQVLTSNGASAAPSFQAGGGSGSNLSVTTKSANYNVAANDQVILGNASGSFSLTLPTAVGVDGKQYWINKIDTTLNVITVATTSGQTIGGYSSVNLITNNEQWSLVSDGANWQILNHASPYDVDASGAIGYGSGLGTTSNANIRAVREGRYLRIKGVVEAGTVSAALAKIFLPSGVAIDSSVLTSSSNKQYVGYLNIFQSATGGIYDNAANQKSQSIFYDGSSTDFVQASYAETNAGYSSSLNWNDSAGTGQWLTFDFTVPVSGWQP